jgi:hypothetical protein
MLLLNQSTADTLLTYLISVCLYRREIRYFVFSHIYTNYIHIYNDYNLDFLLFAV